ncbi:hypothetical protein CGLAU_04395 [Corynebacterium glaucum]|uniref:Uncharacterized protein n=1 Tax=Corynebacterium glaucum TaxID=187491 RepID=A0A1Q2HVJ4_9CORY|nr:hypothetical protein [Corynebacterium glaucum]AQQ14853.1 hypothetical protein CGLAU_04395 [Corynebacterium glaucum]
MADSFSELRGAGGSNKPWIAAGVSALAFALIMIALAAAWWSARPQAEPNQLPATVTVTAQPSEQTTAPDELAPAGTYSGRFNSLDPATETQSWVAVATFGGGSATLTYPDSGCSVLIDESLDNHPLTQACITTPGTTGTWEIDASEAGLVHMTFLEDNQPIAGGTLSIGLPG